MNRLLLCFAFVMALWAGLPLAVAQDSDCGNTTLPTSEDFQSTSLGQMPQCWGRYPENGQYTSYVGKSNYYGHDDFASLKVDCSVWGSRPAGNRYVVLPAVDPQEYDLSSLMLSFWARKWSYTREEPIVVGMMANLTDTTTFVPVATVTLLPTDLFVHFEVPLNNYTGTNTHIALKMMGGESGETWYLDDIEVVADGCAAPTNLRVDNEIMTNNVELRWGQPGNASVWEVAYDTIAFHPNTSTGHSSITTSNHMPFVMPPLNMGTMYWVYVRSICSMDNQSSWTGPLMFTAGSYNQRPGSDTIIGCGYHLYDAGGPFGDLPGLNTTTYENSYTTILLPMPGSVIEVEGFYENARVGNTLSIYNGSLATGTPLFRQVGDGNSVIGPITSTTGPLTVQFTMNGNSSQNTEYSMDGFDLEVRCVYAGCTPPETPLLVSVDNASAQLIWNDHNMAVDSFTVIYGPAISFSPGNPASYQQVGVVGSNSTLLTGLNPSTTYKVAVRSHCGEYDESGWSTMTEFTTACAPITHDELPLVEHFGDYRSFQLFNHPCWYAEQAFACNFRVELFNNGLLVLPLFDDTLSDLMVAFKSMNIYQGNLCVGVMTDPRDITTFDTIAQIAFSADNLMEDHMVPLTNAGNARYIAFRGQYAVIDDIVVDYYAGEADCPAPAGLNVATTADNELLASWTGTANQYLLRYADLEEARPAVEMTVSGNSTVLSGLQPNTRYLITVRSLCGNNAQSHPSAPHYFSTPCAPTTALPYYESFDHEGAPPYCWSYPEMAQPWNEDLYIGVVDDDHGAMRGYSLSIKASRLVKTMAVLPEFEMPVQMLKIGMMVGSENSTGTMLVLGVMSNPDDTNTFVELDSVELAPYSYHYFEHDFSQDGLDSISSYRIAMYHRIHGLQAFTAFIDSVTVAPASCRTPALVYLEGVTDSTISLRWVGVSDYYNVSYTDATTGHNDSDTTSLNHMTITGLMPNTAYHIFVSGYCNGIPNHTSTHLQVTMPTVHGIIVTVTAPDGLVTLNGVETSAYYGHPGDEVVVEAIDRNDCHFIGWSDGYQGRIRHEVIDQEADILLTAEFEGLGINDITLHDITLYPNPSHGIINLFSPTEQIKRVTLFDLTGQQVATYADTTTIDISQLPKGSYIVQIQTASGGVHNLRVVCH